jgi:BA14K-like protein
MFTVTSNFGRAGVVALGVLAGFGGTAMTAPLGPIDRPIPATGSNLPIELAQGGWRGGSPRAGHGPMIWPRYGGGGGWRGGMWNGNRAWRGNGNWRGRYWNGGHGHYGHYNNYFDDNVGVFLGLGLPLLGLGLGGYGGGYYPGYYNGYYPGYADGGYYPRRYYRTGNGHVRWCYSRYRSYRAWDNTYQPYYGPRRQCYSPYG